MTRTLLAGVAGLALMAGAASAQSVIDQLIAGHSATLSDIDVTEGPNQILIEGISGGQEYVFVYDTQGNLLHQEVNEPEEDDQDLSSDIERSTSDEDFVLTTQDGEGEGEGGGEEEVVDEDTNRGHGNDEDGVDEGNPGGRDRGEDGNRGHGNDEDGRDDENPGRGHDRDDDDAEDDSRGEKKNRGNNGKRGRD